jgi:hypothetical protein
LGKETHRKERDQLGSLWQQRDRLKVCNEEPQDEEDGDEEERAETSRKGAVKRFWLLAAGFWLQWRSYHTDGKVSGGRLEICGTGPGSGNSRDWIEPAKVAYYYECC